MNVETYHRLVIYILLPMAIPLVLISILVALWVGASSAMFIQPRLWVYDPETDRVTFHRIVIGERDVIAEWTHEITTINGLECSATGKSIYAADGDTKATFPLPEELRPCIESGEPFSSHLVWKVYYRGTLPLPPVTLEQPSSVAIK